LADRAALVAHAMNNFAQSTRKLSGVRHARLLQRVPIDARNILLRASNGTGLDDALRGHGEHILGLAPGRSSGTWRPRCRRLSPSQWRGAALVAHAMNIFGLFCFFAGCGVLAPSALLLSRSALICSRVDGPFRCASIAHGGSFETTTFLASLGST